MYGGIHYMMAITEGVEQGQKIGNLIIKKLHTKKSNKTVVIIEDLTQNPGY